MKNIFFFDLVTSKSNDSINCRYGCHLPLHRGQHINHAYALSLSVCSCNSLQNFLRKLNSFSTVFLERPSCQPSSDNEFYCKGTRVMELFCWSFGDITLFAFGLEKIPSHAFMSENQIFCKLRVVKALHPCEKWKVLAFTANPTLLQQRITSESQSVIKDITSVALSNAILIIVSSLASDHRSL